MNYYFVMDDKVSKDFNFMPTHGNFAFEIQENPFEDDYKPRLSFYKFYEDDSPGVIYFNFANRSDVLSKIDFQYDYYKVSAGFLISSKLLEIFKKFNIQDGVYKKVKFTVKGQVMDSPDFYLFGFKIHTFDNPAPDFVDYEKTELLPSKTNNVVTRKLVLKDEIEFDIFQATNVELLSAFGLAVTEEVKDAIENNNCGKGLCFLPIETAQEEYCKNSFKDFNDLIKRPKPRIPGIHS